MATLPTIEPHPGGKQTSLPGLPPVLRESLPRRLSTACLIFAGVTAVMLLVNLVECLIAPAGTYDVVSFYVSMLSCIVVAIAVAVWAHRTDAGPRTTHFVGLAFQVVGTFGIALASIDFPLPDPAADGYVGIPWTCPWILAYPLMVPSIPRYAAIAGVVSSLACAAAVQFRLVVLEPGALDPSGQLWFGLLLVNLVCAAWGVAGSVILNQLGRQLSEARLLGSYELKSLLGKGGMGEVWEGKHRLLSRPAAIKLIRADVLGAEAQEALARHRFEREAQTTAALRSPHSVELYDFGVAEDGTFFYVMELLHGIDLRALVERFGPVEPARAIHWLRQACRSLAEAHHHRLVHRDIKPANLHVGRFGLEWDFLKVLDFGLVKPQPTADGPTVDVTGEHSVAGTPAFMAPEMATREGEPDGTADIYALGCVAYWLLTGRLVFEADSPVKMIVEHVRAEPVAPSECSELEISPELDAVVLACLRKDPSERPRSALDLAERLGQCPEAGRWTEREARQWWERHLPERTRAAAR